MTAVVVRGDAAHLPFPDGSVDLIVCSPPYFGLRSYSDGGEHYDGQIGSEATPGAWLEALWACTAEWVRVLKPSGSLFVNLGDSYAGQPPRPNDVAKAKSLRGLPWRYAIGCVDRLGLILRAEVVWSKPNGLPESVQDRVRRSHEQVFHFTVRPRYFAAVDEIREGYSPFTHHQGYKGAIPYGAGRHGTGASTLHVNGGTNPLGKLPGSVWSIPSAPLVVPSWVGVDHFAAFPPELVRRIVLGWSPSGVCTVCGEGRRPVVQRDPIDPRYLASNTRQDSKPRLEVRGVSRSSILRTGLQTGQSPATTITGYACACPVPDAPARPAVVVDPFGGTGTTALVASVLGRVGVTVDRSGDYCRLAAWRVRDRGERARAMNVPRPPPVPDGQGSLFDDVEAS